MICLIILFVALCTAYVYIGYAKKKRIKNEEVLRIKNEGFERQRIAKEKAREEYIKAKEKANDEARRKKEIAQLEIRRLLEENRKSYHENKEAYITETTESRGGLGNHLIIGWEKVTDRNGKVIGKRAIKMPIDK